MAALSSACALSAKRCRPSCDPLRRAWRVRGRRMARRDVRGASCQFPSNTGLRFAVNASYARRKSWVCMRRPALPPRRRGRHPQTYSILVQHPLRHAVRERGARGKLAASACACGNKDSAGVRRLKKPQLAPSSADIAAAGEQQLRGASLADDARQNRARAHVAAREADAREQKRDLARAACRSAGRRPSRGSRPAPAHTPSTAATIGCGQGTHRLHEIARHAREVQQRRHAISVSGPMISCTSPPEQKLPPAPVMTMARTSVGVAELRNRSRSSA